MRIDHHVLALAGLLVLGCTDSHGRSGDAALDASCSGPRPASCTFVHAPGGATCCTDTGTSPECAGGAWRCPAGTVETGTCTGFFTRDRCMRDAGPVATPCDVPSQCRIRAASCCGSCGAATADDVIALHDDDVAAYEARVCEDTGCPECARPRDPWLVATCRARACVAIDLRTDPLTECATASDCVLEPVDCCACGALGPSDVVAVAPARGSFGSLICDPDADCPPCVPDYGTMRASCSGGRCVVLAEE